MEGGSMKNQSMEAIVFANCKNAKFPVILVLATANLFPALEKPVNILGTLNVLLHCYWG